MTQLIFSPGDRVFVFRVADAPASAPLDGRSGTIVLLDPARALACVQLERGTVHAMPLTCLRHAHGGAPASANAGE